MNTGTVSRILLAVWAFGVCALSAARADGATAYLKGTDSVGYSAMTNAAKWGVGSRSGAALGEAGAALPTDVDYFIESGYQLRTPFYDFTFPGRSLTLASGSLYWLTGNAPRTYGFNDLILRGGEILNLANPVVTVTGRITVTAPAAEPFGMADCHRSPCMIFDAEMHGDENAALWLFSHWSYTDSWGATNSTFHFVGNALENYRGLISLHQFRYSNRNFTTSSVCRAEIRSGTVTTPARIKLNRHCRIGALAGGDVFALNALDLADGAGLDVPFDAATQLAGLVAVTGTFAQTGRTIVRFLGTVPDATADFAILKAPRGVTLSAADFTIGSYWPVSELRVEEDADGLSTLVLRVFGGTPLTQTVADAYTDKAAEKTNFTFNCGAHWEGGVSPGPDTICYSPLEMRNDGYPTPIPRFPGRTLLKCDQLDLFRDLIIDDLRVYGGNCTLTAYSTFCSISGRILHDTSLSSANLSFAGMNNRTTYVHSVICGNGIVNVYSGAQQNNQKAGVIRFTGDNSAWSGKLSCYINSSTLRRDDLGVTFEFTRPEALGGPMDAFNYAGHEIRDFTRLVPCASMTLNRANCGFYVGGTNYFVCADGVEFTLLEHMTWNGVMKKTGAGTLALGGSAPNFKTSTGTVPQVASNRLVVAEGALRPVSAEAFQGLQVEMAEGTEIVLDVPTDAAQGLGRYGMLDTAWATPFVLPAGGVTVRVTDPEGNLKPSRGLVRPLLVPVMTVTAGAADAVRGKLNPVSPYVSRMARLVEIPSGDNVTFAVCLEKGMVINLR